uniref:Pyrin domain-containing protein n=1 Tax=Paramormyrops kingsleyae TaxID=1676925 RepID=A0A3B3SUA7_9TELE
MEKTVLDCVIEALDGLSADNFKRFKVKLCETRKIKYGQIENETTVDVAQRIVSTFTKAGAAKMTADVLRAIGLNGDAETLETEGNDCKWRRNVHLQQYTVGKKAD